MLNSAVAVFSLNFLSNRYFLPKHPSLLANAPLPSLMNSSLSRNGLAPGH